MCVDLPRCPTFLTDGCLGVPKDVLSVSRKDPTKHQNQGIREVG